MTVRTLYKFTGKDNKRGKTREDLILGIQATTSRGRNADHRYSEKQTNTTVLLSVKVLSKSQYLYIQKALTAT